MTPLHLPWLPAALPDFTAACRTLRSTQPFDAAAFRRLATLRLNLQQLTTLARALPKTVAEMPAGALRLSVLSNATTDLLTPAIAATAPRHDLWFEVRAGAFGTYAQEVMDLASQTHQWHPDLALLALDYRAFDLRVCAGDEAQANGRVEAAINSLFGLATMMQR